MARCPDLVQNNRITNQDRVESLDNDRQPLYGRNETSRLLADTSVICGRAFKKLTCRVIHLAQSLQGDWKKRVRREELRIFLAFPDDCQFRQFSSSASCGSDVILCCGADDCHILS